MSSAAASAGDEKRLTVAFIRIPIPGEAKTRLIPAVGADAAADVQHEMTSLLLSRLRQACCSVEIRWTGGTRDEAASRYGSLWPFAEQGDGDLGQRLARASESGLQRFGQVVIVGSDCPELTAERIDEAFGRLGGADVVIGPAHDGGYYLIGMRRWLPALFRNIEWSTCRVLDQTLARAKEAGASLSMLEPLGDVDEPADLPLWERVRAEAAREGPSLRSRHL